MSFINPRYHAVRTECQFRRHSDFVQTLFHSLSLIFDCVCVSKLYTSLRFIKLDQICMDITLRLAPNHTAKSIQKCLFDVKFIKWKHLSVHIKIRTKNATSFVETTKKNLSKINGKINGLRYLSWDNGLNNTRKKSTNLKWKKRIDHQI